MRTNRDDRSINPVAKHDANEKTKHCKNGRDESQNAQIKEQIAGDQDDGLRIDLMSGFEGFEIRFKIQHNENQNGVDRHETCTEHEALREL